MNKISNKLNGNRFIPVEKDEKTALELIKKVIDKSNEVVEQVNTFESEHNAIKETVNSFDEKVTQYNNEVLSYKQEVDKLPTINANAEVLDARCGKATLGEFNREISSQLEHIVSLNNVPVSRLSNESDDTLAVKRAIEQCKNMKGGLIQFSGTLYVTEPIKIDSKYININGLGENSIIKYTGEPKIKSVITFDCGDWYGLRSIVCSGFTVDANNNAEHCYLLGDTAPLVEVSFNRLIAKNSIGYGFVFDCTQNSKFELLNTFNCGGGVALLNGAGNNTFTRCDISNILTKESFYFDSDENYNCYKGNIFGNAPSNNKFYDCISETNEGTYFINCVNGKRNLFYKLELSVHSNSGGLNFGTNSQFNKIEKCNFAYNSKNFTPIVTNGFKNNFDEIYIENCLSNTTIKATNRTILGKLTLTASAPKKYDVPGDYLMLEVERDGIRRLESSTALFPTNVVDRGMFYFNDNDEIGFSFKNKNRKLKTIDVNIKNNISIRGYQSDTRTCNISQQLTGEGVWKLNIYCYKGDGNQGIFASYIIAYKKRSVNSLKNVHKIIESVHGAGITISGIEVTDTGLLSLTINSDVLTSFRYVGEVEMEMNINI